MTRLQPFKSSIMKITPATRRSDIPAGAPVLQDPVNVVLDVPVYYVNERGPIRMYSAQYCERIFATSVLKTMNAILRDRNLGLAHLGIYNARMARHADGRPILPERWSNHSYGCAMDFKGVVLPGDEPVLLAISALKQDPAYKVLLTDAEAQCRASIVNTKRKPEIVDEGGWVHIGIWP